MGRYLGIDLGSTSITALVIDTAECRVVRVSSCANDAETTTAADKARGYSEWNFDRMYELALAQAGEACRSFQVHGVGVTGQQKGCQLIRGAQVAGPFTGWQDRRTNESPDELPGTTYLDLMAERGGAIGHAATRPHFADTGCPLAHGYTAPLLFWIAQRDALPADVGAATAPDRAV